MPSPGLTFLHHLGPASIDLVFFAMNITSIEDESQTSL